MEQVIELSSHTKWAGSPEHFQPLFPEGFEINNEEKEKMHTLFLIQPYIVYFP